MQYITKGKNERKCKPATPLGPLGSRQMTTTQSFHSKKLYDKGSVWYRHITHQLASFEGCQMFQTASLKALNFMIFLQLLILAILFPGELY